MTITVYTRPGCIQCDRTKAYLNRQNLDYEVVDVSQDEDARTRLVADGWASLPVVDVATPTLHETWAGFNLDRLRALAHLTQETP